MGTLICFFGACRFRADRLKCIIVLNISIFHNLKFNYFVSKENVVENTEMRLLILMSRCLGAQSVMTYF